MKAFQTMSINSDGALGRDPFRQLLQYERMRADRLGCRFTLVTLRLDFDNVSHTAYRRFLAELFLHLRDTDHAGWFSEARLGILLPDTTISGAQTFIQNLHASTRAFSIIRSIGASMYPRVGNIKMVVDEEDEEQEYYSTYEKKMESAYLLSLPKWKRYVDVAGAVLGLLLTSPVFFLLAPFISLISRSSPFSRQLAVGLGGHTFTLLKFRTLRNGVQPPGLSFDRYEYIRRGDRLPAFGPPDENNLPGATLIRILRLDDIPQFFNILKGDMSLVGPRPCDPSDAELFQHWNKRRFDSLPGMTGDWHLRGIDRLSFEDMMRLDIRYEENLSFFRDLYLIVATPPMSFAALVRRLFARRPEAKSSKEL